jgi:hypothetical protein
MVVSGERRLVSTRDVSCRAYERSDGLYEIESALIDTKPYAVFVGDRGCIDAGEPFHEMLLRLVIDGDLNIRDVEARTLHAPYLECASAGSAYAALIGLNLGEGFLRRARALLGRTAGCTHMTELLGPAVTTALQAVWHVRDRIAELPSARLPKAGDLPPRELGQCYALRPGSDAVRRHYSLSGVAEPAGGPTEA